MKAKPARPRRQRVTPAQLAIKSGDAVLVRLESGIRMPSVASSEPWQESNRWLIRVDEDFWVYDLSRVMPVDGMKV